ncbi:MAG: guanylate kinase [Gammaproteobacteria bacterium]
MSRSRTSSEATGAAAPGRGTLLVLSAPSGAGKTTLVKTLLAREPGVRFSISYTTRAPRPGEKDGTDYCFVDQARFRQMVAEDAFLEHAEVFGNFYGTSRSQVEALRAGGHDVLMELDWQGARQIRANAPDCRTVFILPPSVAELERRLRSRATDSEDVIGRRLGQALDDMAHWAEFGYVIVNEQLDDAVQGLIGILRGEGRHLAATEPAVASRARSILSP